MVISKCHYQSKFRWNGHVAKRNDNRQTNILLEWQRGIETKKARQTKEKLKVRYNIMGEGDQRFTWPRQRYKQAK